MDSRKYWLAVQTEKPGLKLSIRQSKHSISKKFLFSFLSALLVGVLNFALPSKYILLKSLKFEDDLFPLNRICGGFKCRIIKPTLTEAQIGGQRMRFAHR